MKEKTTTRFMCLKEDDILFNTDLAQVKGGLSNKNESEWEIIYIDGKPYLVRKNSNGEIVEIKSIF